MYNILNVNIVYDLNFFRIIQVNYFSWMMELKFNLYRCNEIKKKPQSV